MTNANLIALGVVVGFCAAWVFWSIIQHVIERKYEDDYAILWRAYFDLIEKCDRLGIER